MKQLLHINKRTLAVLLFTALVVSSCKKLIEIPPNPPNEIPSAHVFADSADIMSAIAGIYTNFKASAYSVSFASGWISEYGGLSSDELHNATTYAGAGLVEQNNIAVDDGTMQGMWQAAYQSMYQINACLQGISTTTAFSDSLKQQLLAEIKVVRALYYFNLVNLWGSVPLVTDINYTTNATLPRTPVDSIYMFIRNDLATARSTLKASYPSDGHMRPNLFTADALSAKVFLYLQQWDSAATMAGQVIGSGLYSLEPDPNNVFLDGSQEAIWQLPANGSYYQTAEANTFNPGYSPTPSYAIKDVLQKAFEPGDLRATDWIGTSSANVNYPNKYKLLTIYDPGTEDYMILRLADQYLILSEAQAHLGQLTDALTNLDMVRSRAGLAGSTASTQNDILAAVQHERQTELFCEWGNRWFDLKRTGAIDSVMNAEKPGLWKPSAALYPIPKNELLSNPFLTQNPGY